MVNNAHFNSERVPITDIVIHPAWQVRKGLKKSMIDRYANTYKAGGDMEPIQLAKVNGVLVLIDGAHRLTALQLLGRDQAEAVVTPMKETEAQWAAAAANLSNGQPLSKRELRTVFSQYIATKQHHKGRQKVKSLREVAQDIPGTTHCTIRNWMKKDYPEMYAKHYEGSNSQGHQYGGLPDLKRPTQRQLDLLAIDDYLKQAAALAKTLPATRDRQRVIKRAYALLSPMLRDSS